MSSASDKYVFEESIDQQDNSVLFQAKKWTYITDSQNGNFNGQIQFDLNTLSSQSQWTSLSDSIIQFPVKLSLKNSAGIHTNNAANILSAAIKNGHFQFVDSIQITIGGNTVSSSQIYTNIDTTYKILSTWDQNTLTKYGDTLGIALDDYVGPVDTGLGITSSLDNAARVATGTNGFDLVQLNNPGYKARQLFNNNDVLTTNLGKSILGTNQAVLGKSNVEVGAPTAAVGSDIFVMYLLASVRMKDISDFAAKMPLCKNLKGFIYVNYNASTHTLTNTGAATSSASANFTTSNTADYGRCAPALLNIGTDGFAFGAANGSVQFKAEVGSSATSNLTNARQITSTARLLCPYYIANPTIDRALTQSNKTFRYNERFVTQFSIDAEGSINTTLTAGITNPKRVILYPYFTGAGSSGNSGFIANPLLSPYDGSPSTTSPFSSIQNFQLYVGNLPMFQQPIFYDYDNWLQEISTQGLDGGQNNEVSSGLISQRQWNQLYRYYTCDVSRRLDPSEDGCSKSIQVSCTNSTKCPLTVIAIIWYEKEVSMDTASGMIEQKR